MKNQKSANRKDVIHHLLNDIWILKQENPKLYYFARDLQLDLRQFFSKTFCFGLIATDNVIKLEKKPLSVSQVRPQKGTGFNHTSNYVFLCLILSFLEGKHNEQQFSLEEVSKFVFATYPSEVPISWKGKRGLRNRQSLVRALEYAVEMRLIESIDEKISDFIDNSEHDALMEKTSHSLYLMRSLPFDVKKWNSLEEMDKFISHDSVETLKREHRVMRRLLFEPVVYFDELPSDEVDYIRKNTHLIEEAIEENTHYVVERYQNAILLVKHDRDNAESLYPFEENMMHKLSLSFCSNVRMDIDVEKVLMKAPIVLRMSVSEVDRMLIQMREKDGYKWSKEFQDETITVIRQRLYAFMTKWKFAETESESTLVLREGAFRLIGAFTEE
ncbi:TIGR02678 family protein [Paenibacillus chitinolyticus]|uniref:TIGR02678 family protein n=1 Tax=Paenibacillus chitinolyticus TaxID=79263 RepID=UPI002DBB8ABC|nr:TIGR02678 family protein [Paenibacillus chitinolyticus]MEC0248687.1 TIGR02678 family protein [Paenibacillus chitinolyticus]